MEKRVVFRITFESMELKDAAELEGKLEEVLDEYGDHRLEVTSISPPVRPTSLS